MSRLMVTLDLDWACEPAIEDALSFLMTRKMNPTVFITHRSPYVEACMQEVDVGLHPYFGADSSHGASIAEVVKHVCQLPHNVPIFRCHRYAVCNASRQAMQEAGMLVSSNVCTDLEIVAPFRDRFGLLEVPIFLEDGGYLWRKHPLELSCNLADKLKEPGDKVILIHPMHFALNSPNFGFMQSIKNSLSRDQWQNLSQRELASLRYEGYGIRNFLIDILHSVQSYGAFSSYITST